MLVVLCVCGRNIRIFQEKSAMRAFGINCVISKCTLPVWILVVVFYLLYFFLMFLICVHFQVLYVCYTQNALITVYMYFYFYLTFFNVIITST